ncbi:MAG: adenosylcobinamide-phosphate synthase CbiB [Methanoregulaceae archaeon]|jgi:adenosylcobinamide-phosphate synthase
MVSSGLTIAAPIFVLVAALVIDRLIGDPHTSYHPVALLGRFIGLWGKPVAFPLGFQRAIGVSFWFLTVFIFTYPFFFFSEFAPWYLYLFGAPFLLKCCFAGRSLEDHTLAVIDALNGSIKEGRDRVKMLVSRDTTSLDKNHILSAAYESLTENLTDSIVSPLFYYSLFGLIGSAFYRATNTMDAMLGYRDHRVRLGWWSARMDDLLNFIPARITVLFLLLYFAIKGRFRPAYRILRRDGRNRPGFNGGIVMAAMAGGIGIRFEKPAVYIIGDCERSLEDGGKEILHSVRVVTFLVVITTVSTLLLLGTLINNMRI